MRFKLNNSNRKLYLRIFLSITLCITITMIILSSILYVNFENTVSDQIYLESVRSLKQVNKEVSNMAETALTISYQIYRDFTIQKLLFYSQPDVFDLTPALTQLVNYRLSIPFIDSIYVYNGITNVIYVEGGSSDYMGDNRETFADTGIIACIDNYKNYRPYIPIPREYINKYDKNISKYYYTFLMYDMIDESNAVVINIKEDWISSAINTKPDIDGSNTFIIDSNGMLVSNSEDNSMMSDYSQREYIKLILKNESSSGYFINSVNNVESLIVYTEPDSFGWRYVRTVPLNNVFKDVKSIRNITILISIVILFIGILISFIVSGRIYSPMRKIINNLETLEDEKRLNKLKIRQEFITNIALGKDVVNEKHHYQNYNDLGINIGINSKIYAILITLDNYSSFIQINNIEDRNLYKFAITNISSEILSQFGPIEATDMGNDIILLVFDASRFEMEAQKSMFADALKKAQADVMKYFELSFSVSVSSSGNGIESLHQLYKQTLETSQYRMFKGIGCIIFEDDINPISAKEYNYPINKEKLLIDALMACKIEEVRNIYDEIVKGTFEHSIIAFDLTISHLLFTINNTVRLIKNNNSLPDDFDVSIPVRVLKQAQTVDEINNKFYDLFLRIENQLEDKRKSKYDNIVNKINSIITTEYLNPGLSIDSIAEELGMSTAYICRLYKQYTLHTILDDIVKIRMEKARELLMNTELSINEIAEKTGYSNTTYFHKAFKTANGVTPSEYRKNNK